jgi:4-hydroxybenzoate polyprenyltransferase
MRPKQWVKNGFVLAPLVFSGGFLDINVIQLSLIAAFYFCIASSATYVLNDLQDIEKDRQHPVKRLKRPLASGAVSVPQALVLLGVLYAVLASAYFVAPKVLYVILGYLVLQYAYTFYLKQQPLLDIFSIAIGFVLRVYAGAVALDVPLSSWMFATTFCLALYLAAIKRRQELINVGQEGRNVLKRYTVELVDRYAEMSATGALIFYSLFVMSARPDMFITIPFVLFGLFRYWYIVEMEEGGESPTDALLKDWQMLLTVAGWVGASLYALWPSVVPV